MSIKHLLLSIMVLLHSNIHPFTIMIDPSGDAKHTGRVIHDTFERGITLQCAELLKKELNKALPHVRIVLTRVPGETIQPLQNASFANRLQVDFYLSICFYPDFDIPNSIAIYQYLTQPTDYWHNHIPLHFYHIDQAHLININATSEIGKKFLNTLQNKSINSFFLVKGLFAIPFKPLIGIKAPALALEVGLAQKNDFNQIIKPIIACIKEIVT